MRKTRLTINYDANGGTYVNGPNKMPFTDTLNFDDIYDRSYYETMNQSPGNIGYGLPNPASSNDDSFFRYKKDGYFVSNDKAWLVGSGDPAKATKVVDDDAKVPKAQQVANLLGCSIAKTDCYKTLYVNWQKNNQMYSYVTSADEFSKPALYSIKSALNTRRELDVNAGQEEIVSSGLNVDIADVDNLTHESSFYHDDRYWLIWKNSDGSYNFINYKGMYQSKWELALDMDGVIESGRNVHIYNRNSSNNQKWQITATGNKQFKISPFTNSGLALDVSGGSANAGTNVMIYNSNNGQNQRWYFDKVGDLSEIYDENFYKNKYADLKSAFGNNSIAYVLHFLKYGMNEGRQGSAKFDPSIYKQNQEDIAKAYGNDMRKYYVHYLVYGVSENRLADRPWPYYTLINGKKVYYW